MTRRNGIIKFLSGLIAIVAYWPLGLMGLLQHLVNYPRGSPQWTAGALLAFVMSAPFVLLCIGLIEAFTGRPFRYISSKWNAMSEGKQGLFAFVLLCLGIGLVGLLLYLAVGYFSA
jgi:hypothetical protein